MLRLLSFYPDYPVPTVNLGLLVKLQIFVPINIDNVTLHTLVLLFGLSFSLRGNARSLHLDCIVDRCIQGSAQRCIWLDCRNMTLGGLLLIPFEAHVARFHSDLI